MAKIAPMLWFDSDAEEAARFYVSLLPDSRIERVVRAAADTPAAPAGAVLVVDFTLAGQKFAGLNGGPAFTPNESVSFQILTDDQAETDRLWAMIVTNGGAPGDCGWCKDRWGFSWQITPRQLMELIGSPDADRARRAMQSMMTMQKIDIAALEAAVAA
ncbi:VOC family protein [Sphingomonas hengshuiensis]|uniref:3-demethylubiquinone-9 3-methyltransferase n=1 Tax=Sphingomonas hengshuiensis TaxID=1609977 RepID=A0A7U5HVJ7_9SPHN|nr:VOC family protein [Sphingomonas hengshuiensis]AJP70739.1 3-demethylubiquinone-9 3-methyltransferase [Sphingomonas hengshuiensis]